MLRRADKYSFDNASRRKGNSQSVIGSVLRSISLTRKNAKSWSAARRVGPRLPISTYYVKAFPRISRPPECIRTPTRVPLSNPSHRLRGQKLIGGRYVAGSSFPVSDSTFLTVVRTPGVPAIVFLLIQYAHIIEAAINKQLAP